MQCPSCGAAEMIPGPHDVTYTYKGVTTVVSNVQGDRCPACQELLLARDEGDRYSHAIAQFRQQVNATLVDPSFIAYMRKKLDLDQREAGEIFGGGVNAFSRYENGKAKPPVALVKLLKLLDQHPDLFSEVKAA